MRKKISLLVMTNTGSMVGQFSVSKSFLMFSFILSLACVAGVGYVVYEYSDLKMALLDKAVLESRIAAQTDEIETQRKQIQSFAAKFNRLKSSIAELDDFEKKIRVIANLEKEEDQEGVFGVGGPMPEDLDAKLDVEESHRELMRDMHARAELIEAATLDKKDDFKMLIASLEKQVGMLAATPAIRPVNGWVTSGFGYRKSPFTGLRSFHKGLDIAAKKGTPIKATADGTVTFAGTQGPMGNMVTIDHGHGLITRYGHLHKILKERGDTVKRGEIVGEVGSTGRSTGSHLHYEVHVKGVPVNPQKYILN